eukprot:715731-Pyramimonas_sp.AAC.1
MPTIGACRGLAHNILATTAYTYLARSWRRDDPQNFKTKLTTSQPGYLYTEHPGRSPSECTTKCKEEKLSRVETLFRLCTSVEGVYVPMFYDSPPGAPVSAARQSIICGKALIGAHMRAYTAGTCTRISAAEWLALR